MPRERSGPRPPSWVPNAVPTTIPRLSCFVERSRSVRQVGHSNQIAEIQHEVIGIKPFIMLIAYDEPDSTNP